MHYLVSYKAEGFCEIFFFRSLHFATITTMKDISTSEGTELSFANECLKKDSYMLVIDLFALRLTLHCRPSFSRRLELAGYGH